MFFHIVFLRNIKYCMKKLNLKGIKKHFNRLIIACLVVVLVFCLPLVSGKTEDGLSILFDAFVGTKSKFQGVIEIWNIDSFEGGSVSKTDALKKVSAEFQKENKGAYVLVRSVSETECENLLKSGQVPDMFSCSTVVAEKLKPYLQKIEMEKSLVYDNFLNAGKDEKGDLFGLAWCCNFYFLISTKSNLEKAGVSDFDDFELSNHVLNLGYEKVLKNSSKTIYSCSVGRGKYLLPFECLKTYNDKGEFLEKSFNEAIYKDTSYSAYVDFVLGNSVVLLGNYHDVIRMENKIKQGKVADVLFEWVSSATDMTQFLFFAKTENHDKTKAMEDFASKITSGDVQNKISKMGLVPVCDFDGKTGVMKHIALDKIKDCKVFNVFVSKKEIEKLQQNF